MAKQALRLVPALVFLVAWAAVLLPGCCIINTPDSATEAYFQALAHGDDGAVAELLSSKADKGYLGMPKEGTKEYQVATAMGKTFQKIESVRVEGDRAWVTALLDGRAFEELILGDVHKSILANIKDPKMRAEIEKKLRPPSTQRMSLELIREDGRWLITAINP